MTATHIALPFERTRVWTAVVALAATFGIGLLAGLNLPRTADHGAAVAPPAVAVAEAPLWSEAQGSAAYQAYRQGEQAGLEAFAPSSQYDYATNPSSVAYQAYRQGEQRALGAFAPSSQYDYATNPSSGAFAPSSQYDYATNP
jgi:hypothetical protein